jgi:hypothetical protein
VLGSYPATFQIEDLAQDAGVTADDVRDYLQQEIERRIAVGPGNLCAMTTEERGPKRPKPIVSNPSTPGGGQPPNRPDGRDEPPQGEQRG